MWHLHASQDANGAAASLLCTGLAWMLSCLNAASLQLSFLVHPVEQHDCFAANHCQHNHGSLAQFSASKLLLPLISNQYVRQWPTLSQPHTHALGQVVPRVGNGAGER